MNVIVIPSGTSLEKNKLCPIQSFQNFEYHPFNFMTINIAAAFTSNHFASYKAQS